jgi:predicted short-subunit dehydrogenase-like oxidoreductase (DUF2520 family)
MDYYNIAFVGAGNLAWHLAPELENYGHKVSIVSNKSKKNAFALIDRLYRASYKKNLDFSRSDIDVIIIAVDDSSIEEIASEIIIPEHCCIIHTSGTQSIDILERSAAPYFGVLYPLQTFTKGVRASFKDTPIFVEGNGDYAFKVLQELTRKLSRQVFKLDSEQRSILHLSAVIASNFSNHMLTVAKSIMDEKDMSFDLLQNVVYSMVQKAFEIGPENGQTGPAVRQDLATLKKHQKLLKNDRDLNKLYTLISNHIIKTHHG